jgi:hypothetical protein
MEKQLILNHVGNLTAEQLVVEIIKGQVTLDELKTTGNLDATKRKKITELLLELDAEDDMAWERARYGNEAKLRDYISKYQKHREEAINLITRIEIERKQIENDRSENIRKIKSNKLTPEVVKSYLAQGIIDERTLIEVCNIPEAVVNRIKTYNPISGDDILGLSPTEIPLGFTEVYFWGIPNSGKTCALSAILNTAHKKGYMQAGDGTGLKYLYTLKNLYKSEDDIGHLLENTPDRTQYLPFTLKKENEKFARSVSLIELSGEVFKCFCKINLGEKLEGVLEKTFETLNNFLTNKNRKIHFFFIDYDPTSIRQDSYTQSDYLEEASKYFTKNKVFSKSTDAIYVVITKSDMIEGFGKDEKVLAQNINKYIDDNYKAFDNYLTNLCKKESINGGRYDIIPFSIGDVYCKRICKINRRPSEIIINLLLDRIQSQKNTVLDFLKK